MTNETTSIESSRRAGKTLQRIAVAAMLAAALFALAIGSGAAKPYSIGNASQQGFVNACRANGGSPQRLTTHVVQCTLPNGYVIVCNFDSGLCVDFPPKGGAVISTGAAANIDTNGLTLEAAPEAEVPDAAAER